MNGKVGGLFNGERQVGGFLGWEQNTILNESTNKDGDTVHKLASWQIIAQSYWLSAPTGKEITVRLYPGGDEYWEGKGFISSAIRKLFNCLIHEPLEIVGEGALEGKRK